MTTDRIEMVAVIAVATARSVDYVAEIDIPATEYDTNPDAREKARINARAKLEDTLIEGVPAITRDQAFEYVMTGSVQTSRYWTSPDPNGEQL